MAEATEPRIPGRPYSSARLMGKVKPKSVLAVLAVALGTVRMAAQEPPLAAVVARARAYVADYQRQLSGVVAEELYVQSEKLSQFGNSGPRRELKSDVLLVRPAGADQYVLLRDVFEVDGKPVRDREERLTHLFLEASSSAKSQVQRIKEESARFNLGAITRTVNVPTLALLALDPPPQSQFQFARTTSGTPATMTGGANAADPSIPKFSVSIELWVLQFREVTSPTVIRTRSGTNLPMSGRLWIEPATGRVLMTELIAGDAGVSGVVNVSYETEPKFGLLVPVAMRERYASRGTVIEGYAIYSGFRRFEVHVDEQVETVKQ